MKFIILLLLLAVTITQVSALRLSSPEPTVLYVSPRKTVPAVGVFSCAVAAFDQALELLKAGPVTVSLYPGVHELTKTIDLSGANHQQHQHQLIVKTVPCTKQAADSGLCDGDHDHAILSGASQVTLTKVNQSGGSSLPVYQCALNATFAQPTVWQVWRPSATPGAAPTRVHMVGAAASYTDQYKTLNGMNVTAGAKDWGAKVMDGSSIRPGLVVRMWHSWTSSVSRIAGFSKNAASGDVQFSLAGSMSDFNAASGNRFSLMNYPASMSAASHGGDVFSFDPSTRVLEYQGGSMGNSSPDTMSLIVPRLHTLVKVTGPRSNVRFEGVQFGYADVGLDQCLGTSCDGQSGMGLLKEAVVYLYANTSTSDIITNFTFNRCKFVGTGTYALWAGQGTSNVMVTESLFDDMGSGGIHIGRSGGGPDGLVHGIHVVNNTIRNGGHVVQAGCGIILQQAHSCDLTHNHIHNMYYTGISTGWTWGYQGTLVHDLHVFKNHIHRIGKGTLSDMGCIYNLGLSPGTVFDHNLCHDVESYGYGGWGLYDDEGTSHVTWRNNIVYQTKCAALHHHYGMDDLLVNNIFADPQQTGMKGESDPKTGDFSGIRSSSAPPGNGKYSMSSFNATRNIVFQRNHTATLFYVTWEGAFKNMTFDNNCYFNTQLPTSGLSFPTYCTEEKQGSPKCKEAPHDAQNSFAEWQAEGKDLHGLLTDPMFTNPYDPSTGEYDFFSISPESPCVKQLGFEPISPFLHEIGGGW